MNELRIKKKFLKLLLKMLLSLGPYWAFLPEYNDLYLCATAVTTMISSMYLLSMASGLLSLLLPLTVSSLPFPDSIGLYPSGLSPVASVLFPYTYSTGMLETNF